MYHELVLCQVLIDWSFEHTACQDWCSKDTHTVYTCPTHCIHWQRIELYCGEADNSRFVNMHVCTCMAFKELRQISLADLNCGL